MFIWNFIKAQCFYLKINRQPCGDGIPIYPPRIVPVTPCQPAKTRGPLFFKDPSSPPCFSNKCSLTRSLLSWVRYHVMYQHSSQIFRMYVFLKWFPWYSATRLYGTVWGRQNYTLYPEKPYKRGSPIYIHSKKYCTQNIKTSLHDTVRWGFLLINFLGHMTKEV